MAVFAVTLRRSGFAAVLGLMLVLVASPPRPASAQGMYADQRMVDVGGYQREYLLHVPQGAPPTAPLVIVLHGGGGRPDAIMRNTGFNDVADQNGVIVAYPAGTPGPGRGLTWNVGGPDSASGADDVDFIRAMLRGIESLHQIDRNRIYATGLSMGGVFAYRLACEMSDTFAAIAAVSATMVEPACRPQSPVAILHIHGTADDRIPIDGGAGRLIASGRLWPAPRQGIAVWSRIDGCSGSPRSSADGPKTTCSMYGHCRAEVEYCTIVGGPHAWPSGMSSRYGTDYAAPYPATERIWQFFAANPKRPE